MNETETEQEYTQQYTQHNETNYRIESSVHDDRQQPQNPTPHQHKTYSQNRQQLDDTAPQSQNDQNNNRLQRMNNDNNDSDSNNNEFEKFYDSEIINELIHIKVNK